MAALLFSVWDDLNANGAPTQGRLYYRDSDVGGEYLVIDLATFKKPKRKKETPVVKREPEPWPRPFQCAARST